MTEATDGRVAVINKVVLERCADLLTRYVFLRNSASEARVHRLRIDGFWSHVTYFIANAVRDIEADELQVEFAPTG